MPKKGMTEEEMQAAYNAWKDTPEWAALDKFRELANATEINTSTPDMCVDFQPYLDALFEMLGALKVPKKSKEYKQQFCRTMFFIKWERNPEVVIDGEVYTISAAANVANYDCRNALFDLGDLF